MKAYPRLRTGSVLIIANELCRADCPISSFIPQLGPLNPSSDILSKLAHELYENREAFVTEDIPSSRVDDFICRILELAVPGFIPVKLEALPASLGDTLKTLRLCDHIGSMSLFKAVLTKIRDLFLGFDKATQAKICQSYLLPLLNDLDKLRAPSDRLQGDPPTLEPLYSMIGALLEHTLAIKDTSPDMKGLVSAFGSVGGVDLLRTKYATEFFLLDPRYLPSLSD